MTTADPHIPNNPGDPVRLPPKKRRPILDFALPATSASSGILCFLAVLAILDASTVWDYAKAVTLAVSATAVSYAVNKLAIERGAELGTIGFLGATLMSIVSILVVGSGLFAATYAGLTLKDVGDLQLQEYGRAQSAYVAARSNAASAAAKVNPAIKATETDLAEKAACEVATSCVSERKNGGTGSVARTMQMLAGRAASIAQQIAAGETAREQIVGRLNGDIAAYQTILGDESIGPNERRARLQAVDARIRQAVGALDAAVPLPLVAAYADELQSSVSVAGRPEVEARLNAILSRHGKSLAAVAKGSEEARIAHPSFPGRPGVSDTFRYIAHFLPIAAIAAVVELIFPLVLWAYTFWALSWSKHKEAPPSDDAGQVLWLPKPSVLPASAAPREADDSTRRTLGRPRRSTRPDIADPDSYFRGPTAWRAPDESRFGDR